MIRYFHIKSPLIFSLLYGLLGPGNSAHAAKVHTPIKVLFPEISDSCKASLDGAFGAFQKKYPDVKIKVDYEGEGLSALRYLEKADESDELPDLSLVEATEVDLIRDKIVLPPLDSKKVQRLLKGMKPYLIQQSRDSSTKFHSLPFLRVAPVVVINHKWFEKKGIQTNAFPQNWKRFERRLHQIKKLSKSKKPILAWSLKDQHNLWFAESWVGTPLWKTNGDAHPVTLNELRDLQNWFYRSGIVTVGYSYEKVWDGFIDGDFPFAILTSTELPRMAKKVKFKWSAYPLPIKNPKSALIASGSQLLVHQPSKEVWNLLNLFYSDSVAKSWIQNCGSYPLKKNWLRWKAITPQTSLYWDTLKKLNTHRIRPFQSELSKTRSLWSHALTKLFSDDEEQVDVVQTLRLIHESH